MLNQTQNESANDLKKRIEMLALTLSLKNDDQDFGRNGGYPLLFSTYIQMLKNDQDEFFTEKENKEKIIRSLERSKSFYQHEKPEQLQEVFEKLGNNDPTDFILIPSKCYLGNEDEAAYHAIGLVVYKKNDEFIVMGVDKANFFNDHDVYYFKVPATQINELSQLFFIERSQEYRQAVSVLEDLMTLSNSDITSIPGISMKTQLVGNCTVTEIEATLRTVLFNCRNDIFSLGDNQIVKPKWHPKRPKTTLEMRERFATAVKGPNPEWNQQVDHVFGYYLCRKTQNGEYPLPGIDRKKNWWYQRIQFLFKYDPYIVEIQKGNIKLPRMDEEELKQNLKKKIDPLGSLHGYKLKELELDLLRETVVSNQRTIDILNSRLPFIKIPVAKEIEQRRISAWEVKNQEIREEIQRRKEVGKEDSASLITIQSLAKKEKLPPIFPENSSLQKVVIFGEAQEKVRLVEKLDSLTNREAYFPYDPKIYTDELYSLLKSVFFRESFIQSPTVISELKNKIRLHSFWRPFSQILSSEVGLRLKDLYSSKWGEEWQSYERTKSFGNQMLVEYIDNGIQLSLSNRAESIFIAISKIYEDFEIWVPLDSRIKQIDQTINGERNDVFDISLRELYHQRNRIKAELVFFENGQRVAPPWEQEPERWKSCQKDHIGKLNNINRIEKTILVYGTPEAREMLGNNQLLIKNVQDRTKVELNIDRYSELVVDTIFERVKGARDKEEFKYFLENWSRFVANKNDFPLLEKYDQASQAQEKLQLKTIFDPNNLEEYQRYTKAEIREKFATKGRKIGLEMAAATSDMLIYFPLDSVNMFDVVHKKENSTGSDLRYLYRNWDRFKEKVLFTRDNRVVKIPWEAQLGFWKKYEENSRIKKSLMNVEEPVNSIAIQSVKKVPSDDLEEPKRVVTKQDTLESQRINEVSHVKSQTVIRKQKIAVEVLKNQREVSKTVHRAFTVIDKGEPQKARVLVKDDQVVVTSVNSNEKSNDINSTKNPLAEEKIIKNKKEHLQPFTERLKSFENLSVSFEINTPQTLGGKKINHPPKTISVLLEHATNQSIERRQTYQLRSTELNDHIVKTSDEVKKKTSCFSDILSRIKRPFKKRTDMATKNIISEKTHERKFRMATLLNCFRPTKHGKKPEFQQATKYPHKTMVER
ncbi:MULTISPECIES: hypothetical protein [unclassified Enterococcus]|uniref:hypothetical protein n=1 Tax=unclassified Enterococcus TaxID=2608891 RepID=UPI001A9C18F5|nr:hypothetical protein [Enterococcus sp. DIV1271a]MBO1298563.1 hypothetical protein [Enterococcus sp. DIV1271a]